LALDLVRLDTTNSEAAAADMVAERLEAAGLNVERHEHAPGRPSLVARLEGLSDEPRLCMTGHLDTVALGGAPWSVEPFGELREGRLNGRGSSDMKGGVAAIVVAAERLAAGGPLEGAMELVLTASEETGCEGAAHLARTGALGRAGALLVAEPTRGVAHVAHKGVMRVRASTEGVAAHASTPQLGRNAIYPLARAMTGLAELDFGVPPHPLLGAPTLSVGTIAGGTAVNVVPDHAEATIDVRTVPGMAAEQVLELLAEAAGPDVALEPYLELAPVATDPGHPFATLCGAKALGLPYFTDAAVLTPAYGGIPTVIWGPGEPDQAHQTDEWADAAMIDEAADAFTDVARRWCGAM
jgi:succinyl-diaminopimelate desuccinylase